MPPTEHTNPVCPSPPDALPPDPYITHPRHPHKSGSILGFFKQLLPQGLETEDLLIIILLLLITESREEDRNNALLTLALYFFM